MCSCGSDLISTGVNVISYIPSSKSHTFICDWLIFFIFYFLHSVTCPDRTCTEGTGLVGSGGGGIDIISGGVVGSDVISVTHRGIYLSSAVPSVSVVLLVAVCLTWPVIGLEIQYFIIFFFFFLLLINVEE